MNKTRALILLGITAAVLSGFLYLWDRKGGSLDAFAQCLADKGVVMYGAAWCSHCQNQRAAFGDAFRLVSYVECPDDPARCLAENISGYPTWILPGSEAISDRRLEGEQELEVLSRESGCQLHR